MSRSLIDAIGRGKAAELMQREILKAIEENQTLTEGRAARLTREPPAPDQVKLLKKYVPIA